MEINENGEVAEELVVDAANGTPPPQDAMTTTTASAAEEGGDNTDFGAEEGYGEYEVDNTIGGNDLAVKDGN